MISENSNSGDVSPQNSSSTADSVLTREEYMIKLQNWINEARSFHSLYLGFQLHYHILQNRLIPTGSTHGPPRFTARQQVPRNHRRTASGLVNHAHEFVIPPLWKRVVAEGIDFLILFVIKMVISLIILETFGFVELENYGMSVFQRNLQNPTIAWQISMEMIGLEILNRLIVCFYEAYWLKGGPCATPGKQCMGLMVIKANYITQVEGRVPETVRVFPCAALGFWKSTYRAVLKSIFAGVMLPFCFAFLFFKFNRTGYDLMSNSVVVEFNENPPRLDFNR